VFRVDQHIAAVEPVHQHQPHCRGKDGVHRMPGRKM